MILLWMLLVIWPPLRGAHTAMGPFLTVFMQNIGLSAGQQGAVFAAGLGCRALAGPACTYAADLSRRHGAMMVLSVVATIAPAMLLACVPLGGIGPMVGVMLAYRILDAPAQPLMDAAILRWLGADRAGEYGHFRLWTAVGWGASAAGVGAAM